MLAKMLSDSYFCQTRSLNVVSAPNLILFRFFNSPFLFPYDNVFAIRCILRGDETNIPSSQLRPRVAKTNRIFQVLSARMVPLPGAG